MMIGRLRIILYSVKKKVNQFFDYCRLKTIDLYFRIFKYKSAPLIISYYADFDDTLFYQKCAMRLKNKLSSWSVESDIVKLENQGNYRKNCLYKPTFIYKKLLEYRKPVMWLDADTDITDPRHLHVDRDKEIFAISLDGTWGMMQAGLLYFNYSKASIYVLREWMLYCRFCADNNLPELDHEALKHCILPRYSHYLNIGYRCLPFKKVGFTASDSSSSKHAQSQTFMLDDKRDSILDRIPTIDIEVPFIENTNGTVLHVDAGLYDFRFNIKVRSDVQMDDLQSCTLEDLEWRVGILPVVS